MVKISTIFISIAIIFMVISITMLTTNFMYDKVDEYQKCYTCIKGDIEYFCDCSDEILYQDNRDALIIRGIFFAGGLILWAAGIITRGFEK